MAKGNMLLGYSRGSVGDVTFYRSGGSQRSRARNRNPKNPKTEGQQAQRSKFANAVKFYKQVTSNFFRFAYEDKKTNESDYNAFMRHNIVNSGYIGAQASKIANWPALGLWEVSNGSLPSIDVFTFQGGDEEDKKFAMRIPTLSTLPTTIADVSQALINTGNWRSGDIFTILVYYIEGSYFEELPYVDVSKTVNADSFYLQFVIDENDTRALTAIGKTVNINGVDRNIKLEGIFFTAGQYGIGLSTASNEYYAIIQCAMIHSRNSDNGLLVSTQKLVNESEYDNIFNAAISDSGAYYNSVIADWDAAQPAILQGGGSN